MAQCRDGAKERGSEGAREREGDGEKGRWGERERYWITHWLAAVRKG